MINKDEFKAADTLIKYAPLLASITLTQGLTWNNFVGGISTYDLWEMVVEHQSGQQ